mgnify:CR=1 FL=1
MRDKALLSYLFIISIFFLLANIASAISPNAISVDVIPANPIPYQNVTITLSSFAANLDSVNIQWIVDDKSILSGIGKKSFSLTTKAANINTRVEIRIFLPDGEINKNINIRPGVLVLLWQANDSHVPPFYKGKALPTPGSEIKVVAMPEITINNKMIDSKSMTYDWKQNYNNRQNASGYSKNSFTFINDYLEDSDNVSVVASTINQQYSSESSIIINTSNPEIHFYKNDQELGTRWEQSLQNNHVVSGEETIIAEPYFISPQDIRVPDLLFYWSLGGRSVSVPSYIKNLIPIKAEIGTSGTTKLKLEIENTEKIYQTAKKEININF